MEENQYIRHHELSGTHWWYVSSIKFFNDLISKYVSPGESILDAGCGTGPLIQSLVKDYPCTGLDYSRLALDFCHSKGIESVVAGTVESIPFSADSFKSVVSLDVLYHEDVQDDAGALKEISRVVKPGGYIILQLPAYKWMMSAHDKKAHAKRRYTNSSMRELLAGSNLKAVRITYRISILFPLAFIQRKLIKSKDSDMRPMAPWIDYLFKAIMRLENRILDIFNLPFGLSVVAVAQKIP